MPFLPVERLVDDVSGFDERLRNLPVELPVVLDHEYTHGLGDPVAYSEGIGESRAPGKRPVPCGAGLIGRDHDLHAPAALATLAGNQDDDDADRPAVSGRRFGAVDLAAAL